MLSVEHAYSIFGRCQKNIALGSLLIAESQPEVEVALGTMDEPTRSLVVRRWGPAILLWVKEKKRPKQNRNAILRLLADFLAAEGNVSPRRSRDICDKLRREGRNIGQITRREFYVECKCGHKVQHFVTRVHDAVRPSHRSSSAVVSATIHVVMTKEGIACSKAVFGCSSMLLSFRDLRPLSNVA